MSLDAETTAFIEAAKKNAAKPRHLLTPAEAREALSKLGELLAKGSDVAKRENREVPVKDGAIELRILAPKGELNGVVVYFHGGGWVVGTNDEFEPMCRELAAASGCAIAMACYRKAPEHPYPGPLNDAWAAFQWVAVHRSELFGSELPLLVGGDSAGANLAAVVALRNRDTGMAPLAGQLLIYPVTNADFATKSFVDPDMQAMLTSETMIGYWNHYVPDPARRNESEASPLLAENLSGLPPAVVLTAEHDVLRDEGEAYATRLREAGVDVSHRRFKGQMHAFMMMIGVLPGSAEGIAFASQEVKSIIASGR